ncbi:MAG: hypothetical protein A4E31_00112 [Methanomassiliicoccales archaeon PtaU1.Bin030]|nr:MAG: hypothetical protein A4E31_00112 [Methanomassiliicoccales archaeon PtaU1.Bin030]
MSLQRNYSSSVPDVIKARGRTEGFYVWMLARGSRGALCTLGPSTLEQRPIWLAHFVISAFRFKTGMEEVGPMNI